MKNIFKNKKFPFFLGHTSVIISCFIFGFLFPIQLIVKIPFWIWLIPLVLLFLGVYSIVTYLENKNQ